MLYFALYDRDGGAGAWYSSHAPASILMVFISAHQIDAPMVAEHCFDRAHSADAPGLAITAQMVIQPQPWPTKDL